MNIFAKLSIALGALIIALTAFIAGQVNAPEPVLGGSVKGGQSDIATTTRFTIAANTATTITPGYPATTTCAARIISTKTQPIVLAFATSTVNAIPPYFQTPAASDQGHIQSASTTVVYDSQFYGCGAIQAYSFDAATNLTITSVK